MMNGTGGRRMYNKKLFDYLMELIQNKDFVNYRKEIRKLNVIDAAEFMEDIPPELLVMSMRLLPKDMSIEVFSEFEVEMQENLIKQITDREIDHILKEMYVDDLVDMLEELPAGLVIDILERVDPSYRNLINRFLQYEEDTAGSVMTIEYTSLKKTMTVAEAIDYLRENGHDSETIYSCYVIDASRVLEGVITLRTLLLTDDQECIEKIIDKKVISVHTDEDVENVADLFNKYDFMTLPVVDSENRLVGIITVDDVIDIIQEEDTEDFEKMAGTLPSDKPYLKTSVWKLAKNRMGWLVLLMLSGTMTALILTEFEDAFLVIPVLVTFIPMLTDTGGNSGAQSSTLIIRGMVLHEIETKDLFKVLFKELKVSLMAGSFLALITYIRLILTYPDKPLIVFVVSIAILATVIIAKLVGALLPFFAKIIKADPAIMAAPLITTIVDAASLLVYFYLARMILHI